MANPDAILCPKCRVNTAIWVEDKYKKRTKQYYRTIIAFGEFKCSCGWRTGFMIRRFTLEHVLIDQIFLSAW